MKIVTVTVTDGCSGCYRARCGEHTATATSCQEHAAKRAAAKALGLCPARKPDGWFPSEYCTAVGAGAEGVVIRRVDKTHFEAHAAGGVG